MDPSTLPLDPAWQPLLSLLSPTLLLLVPLVTVLTQGALALPGIRRLRSFGFLVAIAIGIIAAQAEAVLLTGGLNLTLGALLHGAILGALASATYKGVHELKKRAGPSEEDPPASSAATLLLFCILPVILAGCSNPGFVRYAVAETGTSLRQAATALDECRRDLEADRTREAEAQWKAYIADQADTVARAIAENRSAKEVKEALVTLAGKFRTERLAIIDRNRERTDLRFFRAEEHLQFALKVLARLDAQARREESLQAQLAQYRDLAEEEARRRLGLPSATEQPAVLAVPDRTQEGSSGSPQTP